MKSTGVVRKMDDLGRVVLPIEIRKMREIGEKDAVEIFTDGDKIILRKYQPACLFCGDAEDVVLFEGKKLCKACIRKIGALSV